MRKLIAASFVVGVSVSIIFYLSPSKSWGQRVDNAAESPPAQPKLPPNIEITPEGGVNFYTTFQGKRMRSFAISPQGSLIAGGVSRAGTPLTNDPPTIDPVEYDKAGAGGGRNWVHDFYFGRFMPGEGQPRLYSRGMFLWGRSLTPRSRGRSRPCITGGRRSSRTGGR